MLPLWMAINHKAEVRSHRVEARHSAQATRAHTHEASADLRLVHPLCVASRWRLADIVRVDGPRELFGGQLYALADNGQSIEVIVRRGAVAPYEDWKPSRRLPRQLSRGYQREQALVEQGRQTCS